MKILYAVHQYFPECYTGTERYTLGLAKQIQRMGHDVTVLTYKLGASAAPSDSDEPLLRSVFDHEGIPVVALQHADVSTKRGGLPGVSFGVDDPVMRAETGRLLDDGDFDLLHCTHPMRVGEAINAARRRRVPVVLHLMDYWLLCPRGILQCTDGSLCQGPAEGRRCAERCYGAPMAEVVSDRFRNAQDVLSKVDFAVSPSRFLIDVFKANGVDTSRFVWSPYGFDYGKLRDSRPPTGRDNTTTFGFIGTVLAHKGVHVLIDAFKRVPMPDIRLRIWGGYFDHYEYYAALRAAAREDARITFEGEYDFDDVSTVIEQVDAVVVPSVWYENAPIVISAAQALGRPVVTSAMGGMAEMVDHGVNGLTFAPGNAQTLSEMLHLLASQADLRREMSRRAVPPPRIEAEAASLEMIYESLVDRSRGRTPPRPLTKLEWVPPGGADTTGS